MSDIPILLLIFNRPDVTERSFSQIREIKPKRLFVAADGPRETVEGEYEVCKETREKVLNNIDWDCELYTLLREKNLGCGKAVTEAFTWFFNHVEEGIIIEDDIIISPEFYKYASIMLDKHRSDKRIMSINAFNFGITREQPFLTKFFNMWGWATWKDRALSIDYSMKEWTSLTEESKKRLLDKLLEEKGKVDAKWRDHWLRTFDHLERNRNSVWSIWDFQWVFWGLSRDKYSIVPPVNMSLNIGFEHVKATHTTIKLKTTQPLTLPARYDQSYELLPRLDKEYENKIIKKVWRRESKRKQIRRLFLRVKSSLVRYKPW